MTLVQELRLAAHALKQAATRCGCSVMVAQLNTEAVALDQAADLAASPSVRWAFVRAHQGLPPRRLRSRPDAG